jgi:hypothetical protein
MHGSRPSRSAWLREAEVRLSQGEAIGKICHNIHPSHRRNAWLTGRTSSSRTWRHRLPARTINGGRRVDREHWASFVGSRQSTADPLPNWFLAPQV